MFLGERWPKGGDLGVVDRESAGSSLGSGPGPAGRRWGVDWGAMMQMIDVNSMGQGWEGGSTKQT